MEGRMRSLALPKVRSERRASPKVHALWLGVVLLGVVGGAIVPAVSAHAVVQEELSATGASEPGMERLFAQTQTTRHPCGTVSVTGAVQGTTASRGTIAVSLPAACRRTAFQFFPALAYTDTASNQAEIGLYTSSWSGNLGTVTVCLSRNAGGCTSNNLNIRFNTVPPASTNVPATTLGTVYGPRVTVNFANPGTATIVVILSVQDNRGGNNSPDAYQQMQISLVITQN